MKSNVGNRECVLVAPCVFGASVLNTILNSCREKQLVCAEKHCRRKLFNKNDKRRNIASHDTAAIRSIGAIAYISARKNIMWRRLDRHMEEALASVEGEETAYLMEVNQAHSWLHIIVDDEGSARPIIFV